MSETVSDIIGKGFKYEERVEVTLLEEKLLGTVAGFVGVANWGPVNVPTRVYQNFATYFGSQINKDDSPKDFSGIAAVEHLGNSPHVLFTRITDGTDNAAQCTLMKTAKSAEFIGITTILGNSFKVTSTTNSFVVSINGAANTTVTLPVSASASALQSVSLPTDLEDGTNFAVGDYIEFYVDGTPYQYIINSASDLLCQLTTGDDALFSGASTSPSASVSPSGGSSVSPSGGSSVSPSGGSSVSASLGVQYISYIDRLLFALKENVMAGDPNNILHKSTSYITINSLTNGITSVLRVNSFPILFPAATLTNPSISNGSNTTSAAIVSAINTAISTVATAIIDSTGKFKISTLLTGATASLQIIDFVAPQTGGLYDFLGIKSLAGSYDYTDTLYYGAAADLSMGTFDAYYTGKDGNDLIIIKETISGIEMMSFMLGNTVLGKISNYSYTVSNAMFFGSLIANDTTLSQYIVYNAPVGATVISNIPDGIYTFSGGTSGITNVNDSQYILWLDSYKNMDIFDVDILAVPGNSTQGVIDKLQEICEYRKDCFAIVDPPEDVASIVGGVPIGSVNEMIYWHNGDIPAYLDHALDSKYLVTYFPWVLYTTESVANQEQWLPPSIVTIEAISRNDKTQQHNFGAPAGKFAKLTQINDIAYYITEEEKGRMYDDNIGNNINPIVFTNRQGFFIDGQKTTQRAIDGVPNAYNRINVMRVSLFIKKKLMEIVPNYFYMPIIAATQKEFREVLDTDIMKILKNADAIKADYQIICDATINTANIEADKGLVAMLIWTPVKSTEKIKVVSLMKDFQVVVTF